LRFSGGEVSQMELAQSQSEYQASLATIPQIELQIAQQEDALSILLGHNPGDIARDRELDDLALPAVPAGLPSELLERRPDLRQNGSSTRSHEASGLKTLIGGAFSPRFFW
jgi:outer membrane protein, multidrug efflux system